MNVIRRIIKSFLINNKSSSPDPCYYIKRNTKHKKPKKEIRSFYRIPHNNTMLYIPFAHVAISVSEPFLRHSKNSQEYPISGRVLLFICKLRIDNSFSDIVNIASTSTIAFQLGVSTNPDIIINMKDTSAINLA